MPICGRRLRPVGVPEGYAPEGSKRRYEAHFLSKLTDSDGENGETDTWLYFAKDCGYLATSDHARLTVECHEVGSMLGAIMKNPDPFLIRSDR